MIVKIKDHPKFHRMHNRYIIRAARKDFNGKQGYKPHLSYG
jgi:hypothetical protein